MEHIMALRPVLQFKISLLEIEPLIWRRIQISDLCNFWGLHVAIQDAMGWQDYHLHQFEIIYPDSMEKTYIGIPDEDFDDIYETLPGWYCKVRDYLAINKRMLYEYDFGDGWLHCIEFEGLHEKQPDKKYPICLDGERACPPEDVGGTPGFYDFLAIISDPDHEEHESMLTWAGGCYNPEEFNPKRVKFDNPNKRWKRAFEGSYM